MRSVLRGSASVPPSGHVHGGGRWRDAGGTGADALGQLPRRRRASRFFHDPSQPPARSGVRNAARSTHWLASLSAPVLVPTCADQIRLGHNVPTSAVQLPDRRGSTRLQLRMPSALPSGPPRLRPISSHVHRASTVRLHAVLIERAQGRSCRSTSRARCAVNHREVAERWRRTRSSLSAVTGRVWLAARSSSCQH